MSLEYDSESSIGISGSAGENIAVFSPDFENVTLEIAFVHSFSTQ